jgi:SAM-dependent methyltransferase
MAENVYTEKFFQTELAPSYASAQRIVPVILELIPVHSVLDVGCGTGHFLRAFQEAGVRDVMGIDGDYVPRDQLVIDQKLFQAHELKQGFDFQRRYDLVISLEVAEHLPADAAEHFIDCLVRHASIILFSVAVPHQGGTGHLNEQWASYWVDRFYSRGYQVYDVVRPSIWRDSQVAWWYKQNIILFANAEAASGALRNVLPTQKGMIDLIHPEHLLAKVWENRRLSERFNKLEKLLASGSLFEVNRTADGQMNINKRS